MKQAGAWIPRDPIAWTVLVLGIGGVQLAPYEVLRPWMIGAMLLSGAGTLWLWIQDRLSTRQVLAGALLARLAAFPIAPSVTDDIYRYIWDGWLQLEGVNPYRFRPTDWMNGVLDGRPDGKSPYAALFPHLNSQAYFSVYPPVSQLVFLFGGAIDALIGGRGNWMQSYYGIKGGFALLEIGGLAMLARMIPARAFVLYAWSPLVILETAGQGHTEAALVFFLVAAVWAVQRKQAILASISIAGAAMVKLYPVLLLPLLWRRFGWKGIWPGCAFMAAVGLPYAALYVPAHVLASLNLYVSLFEFFAGPYFAVKHGLLVLTETDFSKTIGPVFRALFLLGVPIVYAIDAKRSWRMERAMLWILGGFLVLSTTVHPWYLLAVLPICVLVISTSGGIDQRKSALHRLTQIQTREGADAGLTEMHAGLIGWLWLGVVAPATYGFYAGLPYWPWVWVGWGGAALWTGVYVYLRREQTARGIKEAVQALAKGSWKDGITRYVIEPIQRRRARAKADRVVPWLPEAPHASQTDRDALRIDEDALATASATSASCPDGERLTATCPAPPCQTTGGSIRILDLGAGEGYVGEALTSRSARHTVQLCDVADLNRTTLPHDLYAGDTLPYADGAFDAVLLYFVLHHCERPERVLAEALRVSSQRVIIVESVVTGPIQHRLLRAADVAANRVRSGGSLDAQEENLSFRPTGDWVRAVEEAGGHVQDVTTWSGYVHPQARIVAAPRSRASH